MSPRAEAGSDALKVSSARWSRHAGLAGAPEPAFWPAVDVATLPESQQAWYAARVDAMRRYFAGEPTESIARCCGVPRTQLPVLAKRCL